MSFKHNTLVLIALPNELRFVEVCPDGEELVLRNAVTIQSTSREQAATGDSAAQDAFALADPTVVTKLREVVEAQSWSGRDVICLVGGSNVACHYYEVPPLKGPALRQALEIKLGQQLHFDVNQAVIAIEQIVGGSGESAVNRVGVAAIHRDIANTVIHEMEQVDLKLVTISSAPSSLSWLVKNFLVSRTGLAAGLYIDEHQSTLVVVNDGTTCVTSELPIGIAEFTAALMRPIIAGENVLQLEEKQAREIRDQYGIPQAQAEIKSLHIRGDRLMPLLEPAIQKFTKQLTQWVSFASTCAAGARLQNLTLVGPGAHLPGMADAISSRLKITAQVQDWLQDLATMTDVEFKDASADPQNNIIGPTQSIESFAAAVGAAKSSGLPDLLPPEIKRERTLQRIRSSVSICGPIVAAATLVFAVLFQRVGADLTGEVAARQQQLASVAQIVDENTKWIAQQERIATIEKTIDDFSRANPNWAGIFKELSVLLPLELRATQYSAQHSGGNLALNVTATVYANSDGRGFDEIVSQTLLLLQRSTFFSRVELISANRAEQNAEPGSSGVLNLRLDLVYPRMKAKA